MNCKISFSNELIETQNELNNLVRNGAGHFIDNLNYDVVKDVNSLKGLPLQAAQLAKVDLLTNTILDVEDRLSPDEVSRIERETLTTKGTQDFSSNVQRYGLTELLQNSNTELKNRLQIELSNIFSNISQKDLLKLSNFDKVLYTVVTGKQINSNKELPSITEFVVTNDEGEFEKLTREQILEKIKNDSSFLDNNFNITMQLAVEDMLLNDDSIKGLKADPELILTPAAKNGIVKELYNIMDKLGISKVSLDQYSKQYEARTGKKLDVDALADINNRLIAINDTGDYTGNLTEEVSHFLVEAYTDQASIKDVLPLVEATEEWLNHSPTYFETYRSQGFKGEQLQEKVRREILGKILANNITNRLSNENINPREASLVRRVLNWLSSFFDAFSKKLNSQTKNRLNELIDKVTTSAFEQEKLDTQFTNNLSENQFGLFFNVTESTLTKGLKRSAVLGQRIAAVSRESISGNLISNKAGNLTELANSLTVIDNITEFENMLTAAATYIDLTSNVYKDSLIRVRNYEDRVKRGEKPKVFLSSMENASVAMLYSEVGPHINELRESIRNQEVPNGLTEAETKLLNKNKQSVLNQLTEVSNDINVLKGKVNYINSSSGNNLINELINKYNLSPSQEKKVRNSLGSVQKDINMMQGFFGNLQGADSQYLGLLHKMIAEVHNNTNNKTTSFIGEMKSVMKALGFDTKKLETLIKKDSNGKMTSYLKSVVDWDKVTKATDDKKIELYNKALLLHNQDKGLDIQPITELNQIGKSHPKLLEMNYDIRQQYNLAFDDWKEQNFEQPFNESFKKKRQEMYDYIETNGVTLSDGTVIKMKIGDGIEMKQNTWARRRREIKQPYTIDGEVDYSRMTDSELQELDAIKRDKQIATSLYDPLTLELKTGKELEEAKALQAINQYYINQLGSGGKSRSISNKFIDAIRNVMDNTNGSQQEKNKAGYEWFAANSGVFFNSDFWDILDSSSTSIQTRVEEYLNTNSALTSDEIERIENLTEQLVNKQKIRTQILKQYKNPKNLAEVDTHMMSDMAMDSFRTLEHEIDTLQESLRILMPTVPITSMMESELTANEAFYERFNEYLDSNPNATLFDFALRHMSSKNGSKVITFKNHLENFNRTGIVPKSKSFERDLIKMLKLRPTATNNEISNALKAYMQNSSNPSIVDEYAKSKLSGYFKRFAPKGFTEFMELVKEGDLLDSRGNVVSFDSFVKAITDNRGSSLLLQNKDGSLNQAVKYLSINPENEWYEDQNNVNRNNKYIVNSSTSTFYGGYGQPKLYDKSGQVLYADEEFIKTNNIDLSKYYATGEMVSAGGVSTEVENSLKMTNYLVTSRFNLLKKQGLDYSENAYKLPQVRKEFLEKARDFHKHPLATLRNSVQEFFGNTVDNMIYGENISGEIDNNPRDISQLTVPKLNVRNIDVADLSEDLLYSYSTHAMNANLYEERQRALTLANQLEQTLLNSMFAGKESEKTNTYKMFRDFKKAYLLGVQETSKLEVNVLGKTLNLTNMFRVMDRALGTVNVGLNPAISVTAATSGTVFSVTEAMTGEFISPKSFKYANARFASKSAGFISETGVLDKTNEVYLLGEKFGIYRAIEAASSGEYNRVLRSIFKDGLGGAPHVLTEMLTFPFAPTAMYGIMHDQRFVKFTDPNGDVKYKLLSSTTFNEYKTEEGFSPTEIKDQWDALEPMAMINMVEIKDGEVHYKPEMQQILEETHPGDVEAQQEMLNNIETDVRGATTALISKIDAKMPSWDKSVASRNALARFLLRHREWLTLNIQNRFKRRHFNYATNREEKGSYVSLFNFIEDIVKTFDYKNMGGTKAGIQEAYNNLTPVDKLNLKRVLIDVAISGLLTALGIMFVAPMADDDDNKDNAIIQFGSYMYFRMVSEQMSVGLLGIPQYKDVVESPIVAANSIKELASIRNYSLETVENGPYEGHSRLYRLVAKQFFTRHYYDLVVGLKDKVDFFRLKNEWTLLGMQKEAAGTKEDKEREEQKMNDSYLREVSRMSR